MPRTTATSAASPSSPEKASSPQKAGYSLNAGGSQTRGGGLRALCLAQCVALALSGCHRTPKPDGATGSSEKVDDSPESNELPKLELRDETPDLLLTWVDDKGDFHVVQNPKDVPDVGREQVRVVITTKEEGTGRLVYVANLKNKAADGTYAVQTLTRAQWNEIGAERRRVRMEAYAAKADAPAPSSSGAGSGSGSSASEEISKDELKANGKVIATIYGASWCKPCHDAEAYLRKLGVNVTKKDIEESRAARAEMEKKLAQAGRMGASIPVIDVAGQLFVGFSQAALKQAVAAARKPEAL